MDTWTLFTAYMIYLQLPLICSQIRLGTCLGGVDESSKKHTHIPSAKGHGLCTFYVVTDYSRKSNI